MIETQCKKTDESVNNINKINISLPIEDMAPTKIRRISLGYQHPGYLHRDGTMSQVIGATAKAPSKLMMAQAVLVAGSMP
jgi:hypothetical protein